MVGSGHAHNTTLPPHQGTGDDYKTIYPDTVRARGVRRIRKHGLVVYKVALIGVVDTHMYWTINTVVVQAGTGRLQPRPRKPPKQTRYRTRQVGYRWCRPVWRVSIPEIDFLIARFFFFFKSVEPRLVATIPFARGVSDNWSGRAT